MVLLPFKLSSLTIQSATRSNLNYLDQLARFHKQHGTNLNRFPSVDKRPLDLYELKKAVESRGGFDRVCKGKKWAEIGRDLGYSGKIMSSLSTSLKNSYQKWLHPYEEYLRVAKPGVQQLLEYENGGPFTPSPGVSPMRKSVQSTGSNLATQSPALRASSVLQATIENNDISQASTPPAPASTRQPESVPRSVTSGFTAVNAGGFTAVNASSPASGFTPANTNGNTHDYEIKRENGDRPRPEQVNPSIEANLYHHHGHGLLKRPLSETRKGESPGDGDSPGRRSKRIKQGNDTCREKSVYYFVAVATDYPSQSTELTNI